MDTNNVAIVHKQNVPEDVVFAWAAVLIDVNEKSEQEKVSAQQTENAGIDVEAEVGNS